MSGLVSPYRFGSAPDDPMPLIGSAYGANMLSPGLAYPGGTTVDDFAILLQIGTTGATVPTGWTNAGTYGWSGLAMSWAAKKLVAGDIDTGVVEGITYGTKGLLAVYRGVATVTAKLIRPPASDEETGVPLARSSNNGSFTKGAGAQKEVSLLLSIDNVSSIVTPGAIQLTGANYQHSDMAASSYTSGATLSASWSPAKASLLWVVFELT